MRDSKWKSVSGFEGYYEVSTAGKVRSLPRTIINKDGHYYRYSGKILKGSLDKDGYLRFILNKNGVRIYKSCHRLVAETFIPNPENKPQVNHKNGDITNNTKSNLEWCTIKENRQHAYDTGLQKAKSGVNHYSSKLSKKDVISIRKLLDKGETTLQISKKFNTSKSAVSRIGRKESYKNI